MNQIRITWDDDDVTIDWDDDREAVEVIKDLRKATDLMEDNLCLPPGETLQ